MILRESFIAYRTIGRTAEPKPLLRSVEDAAKVLRPYFEAWGPEVEHMALITCDTRRRIKHVHRITAGTATASLAHPREVFRLAIMDSATCLILAHNHPSGDPEPSAADVGVTRQLKEAARIIGIELSDHIIIGEPEHDASGKGWFSFKHSGLL